MDNVSSQRRELNRLLNNINQRAVILQKEKKKEANYLLKNFLENRLINEMKSKSEIFNDIYQRLFYTGSYYDGLKVGEPDEFDINVVLNMEKVFSMSHERGSIPGYKYYLKKENPGPYGFLFQQAGSGDYYLVPEKLMAWLQGILNRSLSSVKSDDEFSTYHIKDVKCSRSGPAWTLHLYSSANSLIDVDFVPVFSYLDDENDEIFLVPKPPDFIHEDGIKNLWRLSFAQKERKEVKKLCNVGQSCFKKITKLLKYLRDQQGPPLKKLASFYIKNFMLLEKRDNPDIMWDDERNLGKYFCLLLKKLHETLQSGFMPSYFVADFNVLESIKNKRSDNSSSVLVNITGNIGGMSKKINENPLRYILVYFKYKENIVPKNVYSSSEDGEIEDLYHSDTSPTHVVQSHAFRSMQHTSHAPEPEGERPYGWVDIAENVVTVVGVSLLARRIYNSLR